MLRVGKIPVKGAAFRPNVVPRVDFSEGRPRCHHEESEQGRQSRSAANFQESHSEGIESHGTHPSEPHLSIATMRSVKKKTRRARFEQGFKPLHSVENSGYSRVDVDGRFGHSGCEIATGAN